MNYPYDISQTDQKPVILVPVGDAGFFLPDYTRWKKVVGKIHEGEAYALVLTDQDEVIKVKFPFAQSGDYLVTYLPGASYVLQPDQFEENWGFADG